MHPISTQILRSTAKKAFRNWHVISKFIKVAIVGKMSIYSKAGHTGGAKLWRLKGCTPGLIACGVTLLVFILSPDQQFLGSGVGTISLISYSNVFRMVKKFFVTQCQQDIHNLGQNVDNAQKDLADSLNRVMASLDNEDSSDDDLYNNAVAVAAPSTPAASFTTFKPAATVSVTAPTHILTHIFMALLPMPMLTVQNHDHLIVSESLGSHSTSVPVTGSWTGSAPAQTHVPAAVEVIPPNAGESASDINTKLTNSKKGRKGGHLKADTDAPPQCSSHKVV
ncbi:uncharacterized protein EDB91DRAFT_1248715 [Suillus paluster]|uniref:uncharacterized protein n=1 Tax=Suillus paluster TaxID=48578 RepID=UPI001B85F68A|nr:uncharacterized protein EDB91DRAFT_1248715 [Suillus paluster]KAG1739956.1 hypothetical protein EDB91DRAFT_1248715 [Suillus paluster]